MLMVGFNRRFSPHIQKMKFLLDKIRQPKAFIMTINAGILPTDHWAQDSEIGGGRIVGEACHFIDLLRFLADSPIRSWNATPKVNNDTISITLIFEDGEYWNNSLLCQWQ